MNIVRDFIRSTGNAPNHALLELVRQVPRINLIHCGDGLLLNIVRDSNGDPDLSDQISVLDNSQYDWMGTGQDWAHRPRSRLAGQYMRKYANIKRDEFMYSVGGQHKFRIKEI